MTASIPPNAIATEFTACLRGVKTFTPKQQHMASIATIKNGSLKMPVPASGESQARGMPKTITVRFIDQKFIEELDQLSEQVEQGNVDQKLMKSVLDKIEKGSGYYLRVKTGKQVEGLVLTSENDRKTVIAEEIKLLERKLQKQQAQPAQAAESTGAEPSSAEPNSAETEQRTSDTTPSTTEETSSRAAAIENSITVLDSEALDAIAHAAQEAAQVFAALLPKPVENEPTTSEAKESAQETEKPPVSQIAQPSTAETRADTRQEKTRENAVMQSASQEATEVKESETERTQRQEAGIKKAREKEKESEAELKKTTTDETEQKRQAQRRTPQTKQTGQVGKTDQEGDVESVRPKTITTPTSTPQPGAVEPAAPPQEQQGKGAS